MANAAGSYATLRTNADMQKYYYWSSTEYDYQRAWRFGADDGYWQLPHKDTGDHLVRACLAF